MPAVFGQDDARVKISSFCGAGLWLQRVSVSVLAMPRLAGDGRHRIRLFTAVVCTIWATARGDIIDNGLISDPAVECGQDGLSIKFRTKKEFEGHVYVKGHYDDKSCRQDATLEESVNFTVSYTSCDVRRQRSSTPRGLYLSATVIISFHPMFITKVDRSYNVQCFYTEVEKTVTQALDVGLSPEQLANIQADPAHRPPGSISNLFDVQDGVPEETITSMVSLPTCRYEVLTGGETGEPVKFATVGQQVYHRWSCEDPAHPSDESPFCATVHSCSVREESGRQALLLDENGCSVDRYLLTNLVYTSSLTGGQSSFVFKFADQPSLFFQCQIRLSLKENGTCTRTSDACPNTLRGKRSAVDFEEKKRPGPDVDVFSQSLTVLEIDDESGQRNSSALVNSEYEPSGICLSTFSFSLLISTLASVLLISAVSFFLLLRRPTAKVSFLEH